jgi:hypothetical protein
MKDVWRSTVQVILLGIWLVINQPLRERYWQSGLWGIRSAHICSYRSSNCHNSLQSHIPLPFQRFPSTDSYMRRVWEQSISGILVYAGVCARQWGALVLSIGHHIVQQNVTFFWRSTRVHICERIRGWEYSCGYIGVHACVYMPRISVLSYSQVCPLRVSTFWGGSMQLLMTSGPCLHS